MNTISRTTAAESAAACGYDEGTGMESENGLYRHTQRGFPWLLWLQWVSTTVPKFNLD